MLFLSSLHNHLWGPIFSGRLKIQFDPNELTRTTYNYVTNDADDSPMASSPPPSTIVGHNNYYYYYLAESALDDVV